MNKNAGGMTRGRGGMGGSGGMGPGSIGPPPIGPGELGPPVLGTGDTGGPDGGNVPPHYPIDPPPPRPAPTYPGAPGNGGYPTSLEAKNQVRAGMGLAALTPPVPKYGGM